MANLENSINTLLSRLETVTARLESVEKQLAAGGGPAPAAAAGGAAASAGAASGGGEDAEFVQEYDALFDQFLKTFVEQSKAMAPEVEQQATNFVKAAKLLRWFLTVVAQSAEPSADVAAKLIEPIGKLSQEASSLRDANRKSKYWEQISAISEGGIGALMWPLAAPKPGPHVTTYKGESEFWSNKILVANKGKEDPAAKAQLAWVNSLNGFIKELLPYIKKFHTTKPAWKAGGVDASSFVGKQDSAGAAAPKAGGPPAPPAGPPPPPAGTPPKSSAPTKGPNTADLFSALNKGEGVTSGLKKVTDDQKTHKNPALRGTSLVPAESASKKETAKKAEAKAGKVYPPEFQLEGNKWKIAFQKGNKDIVIPADQIEAKHTVYIFQCENSTVNIKGKVNAIIVDSCKKVAVVFENAIASVEIVNVNGAEIQCSGRVPSWAIDKSSTISVYLTSEAGLDTEFITSKSDSTNILVPGKKEGDDLLEFPVPEQYRTIIKTNADNSKNIVTNTVEHAG